MHKCSLPVSFCPVWIRWCVFKLSSRLKAFPHSGHTCLLSCCKCIFKCRAKWSDLSSKKFISIKNRYFFVVIIAINLEKIFSQMEHFKCSSLSLGFKCIFKWRIKCSPLVNPFLQMLQSYAFSMWSSCMCFFKNSMAAKALSQRSHLCTRTFRCKVMCRVRWLDLLNLASHTWQACTFVALNSGNSGVIMMVSLPRRF